MSCTWNCNITFVIGHVHLYMLSLPDAILVSCNTSACWAAEKTALRAVTFRFVSLCSETLSYNLGSRHAPSLVRTIKGCNHFSISASTSTTARQTLASIATFKLVDVIQKASAVAGVKCCICAFLCKGDASLPW